MSEQQQEEKIGALWTKSGNRGDYMTGNIEIDGQKIGVVVFKNDRKTGNQPDWRILKAKPRDQKDTVQAASITDQDVPF